MAELVAKLCSYELIGMARAEAVLAAHQPVPQWAVESVLLSSDLVPHLLATLEPQDSAAAVACSVWAEGWRATSEGRRRLRQVPFHFPQELLGADMQMTVIRGKIKRRKSPFPWPVHDLLQGAAPHDFEVKPEHAIRQGG